MRVIVTKPSQADINEGIHGDMIGYVDHITPTFIHVKFIRQKGFSTYSFVYPFFPHQIKPFKE